MAFGDFVKSQFLDVIEFVDESQGKLLVSKFERKYVTESGIGKDEIRQGSQVIVRNGQAAVFVSQGVISDILLPGRYTLDTKNLPLLSEIDAIPTLMNSPIKSDLYFVNLTQFIGQHWGTKNPISIPTPGLPGGMPIRSFGNFSIKVSDYVTLIEKVAGVKTKYTVEDVKDRVVGKLDQMLMKGDEFEFQTEIPEY